MASKKAVVMTVAVLAVLLLPLSATVSARPDAHVLDLFDLLSAKHHVSNNFVRVVHGKSKGNKLACCDNCYCTKSDPPQCTCADVFTDAKECDGCDVCITYLYPPRYRCLDVTDSCSPPCSSDAAAYSVLKNKVVTN
ncbi:Bowman-Birk type proteinase inhibitor PVI-3(2) [Ziziphus jujuba]|uniref:Bowman-Birk type proteinase inhibitor PVI-3(2) n=1 Tax=Ziziphus jujuba TaxID=326968 RepID=A0A6P4A3Y6_ZIZJJ|nr:Bowman-Birk type proteinase inhibitor PVI-3(2) [Ziziphus jujuba]